MLKEQMDNKLKERFNHVYWSIYLYNLSLSELKIVSNTEYNQSELQIVNSHTFNFYKTTLHYCFIIEYNKILEKGRKDKNQNISSIIQLNDIVYSLNNNSFSEKYIQNMESISKLKSSTFYEKIRNLRDKKFAHADNVDINIPFTIIDFSKDDFMNGFNHLSILKKILDNLTKPYNFECHLRIPNWDDRTANFIKFHAEYRNFYLKNLFGR
jgi:hypothetical protein